MLNLEIVDALDVQLDRAKCEGKYDIAAVVPRDIGVGSARWVELEVPGT